MNEQKVKKRGWVKNVAIIFLTVLLVLTFFSNTIMNRSLPEVAATYVTDGSISPKIRGSGNVTANEKFEVKSEISREILSVPVKTGDKVEVGNTLLVYAKGNGDELKTAQDTLDDLVLAYQKALINASSGKYSADKAAVSDAQTALDAAKVKRDANIVSDNDVSTAEANVKICETTLAKAQEALAALGDPVQGSTGDYAPVTAAYNTLKSKELLYKTELEAFYSTVNANRGNTSAEVYKEYLSQEYSKNKDGTEDEKKLYQQHQAYEDVKAAQTEYNTALATYNSETTIGNMDKYNKLNSEVTSATNRLATAKSAQESILAKKTSYDESITEVTTCQKTLQDALMSLEKNISLENLDIAAQKKDIADQNKVIADLKGDGDGATITSKINGIVTEINATAGNTTDPGSTLMVVEVPDRGYQVSFSVTKEQSKKVKPGDTAEILYNYNGTDITATLTGIKPDPESKGKNKRLVFDLKGEVESGEQLNLSIGEKGKNYETIVPSSAIRSDNNGSFVLAVIAKSSPLGNRYIATRIDVKVLATDDTFSAVSGGLAYNDFVITTSTKPIEPGTQVRLADE